MYFLFSNPRPDNLSCPSVRQRKRRWGRKRRRWGRWGRREGKRTRRFWAEEVLKGFFSTWFAWQQRSPRGSSAPPVDPRRLLRHSHVDDGGSQTFQSLSISPKLYYIFSARRSYFLGLMDRSLRGSRRQAQRRRRRSPDESNKSWKYEKSFSSVSTAGLWDCD